MPAFERAIELGADFVDSRVATRGIARADALGLQALVYTVNEPSRLLELQKMGADGISTVRTGPARETLSRRPG